MSLVKRTLMGAHRESGRRVERDHILFQGNFGLIAASSDQLRPRFISLNQTIGSLFKKTARDLCLSTERRKLVGYHHKLDSFLS
jgi:hypothetical protein